MTVLGVVPAAGGGTRLRLATPKVLAPVQDGVRVWDILSGLLSTRVDDLVVVLSPRGRLDFSASYPDVVTRVQPTPSGTGDAVFTAEPAWSSFTSILVVWGDQANLSAATVESALAIHRGGEGPRLTLPLARQRDPYVEYRFASERLDCVRLSREGEECSPGGWADVGVFVLTTAGLGDQWRAFCAASTPGARSGERNFLPFLPWLDSHGWSVRPVLVTDADEARGINDPADLAFTARRRRQGA